MSPRSDHQSHRSAEHVCGLESPHLHEHDPALLDVNHAEAVQIVAAFLHKFGVVFVIFNSARLLRFDSQ